MFIRSLIVHLKDTFDQTWFLVLSKLGFVTKPDFTCKLVESNPSNDSVPDDCILIVGGKDYRKWAYLRCPCGCRDVILLSLSQNRRPRWTVDIGKYNIPTIHPSVRREDGCYCHFWLQNGMVEWCGDTGQPY